MITEFALWLLSSLVSLVGAAIPDSDPSSAVTAAASGVGSVLGWFGGFGVWLPLPMLGSCAVIILSVYGVALTIRLIRIVASFLSGGGGSAA